MKSLIAIRQAVQQYQDELLGIASGALQLPDGESLNSFGVKRTTQIMEAIDDYTEGATRVYTRVQPPPRS